LLGISVSAFYSWLNQGARDIAQTRENQTIRIKQIL